MVWIKMILENAAENELKDWYDKLREPSGGMENILRIHSINTSTLKVALRVVLFGDEGE